MKANIVKFVWVVGATALTATSVQAAEQPPQYENCGDGEGEIQVKNIVSIQNSRAMREYNGTFMDHDDLSSVLVSMHYIFCYTYLRCVEVCHECRTQH